MTGSEILAPDHPGTFIVEELEARGWAKGDLAYVLGMDPAELSRILNGKVNISPRMAIALGDALDIPAEFFANLQKLYDLGHAGKADEGVKTRAAWAAHFPVREMLNRGWIEDSEPSLLHLQMLRFFNKNNVSEIPFIGCGRIDAHAASKSNAYDAMTEIQYVWLHRVKRVAEQMDCPRYSRQRLVSELSNIRAHMMDADDLHHIPSILRSCGVRLVFVEAFAGSKIDGVCVWLDDQPVIGMSLRLDKLDNFCFTLRHECEHVLHEHGKDVGFMPVDEFDGSREGIPEEERVADTAAQEFLIPRTTLNSFILRKAPYISERDVLSLAARMELHPAIVVGQIQHATGKWNWLTKHIKKVRAHLVGWEYSDGWGQHLPTGL
jgi:HTH-type transcriptional regulator / antitoxin HigA